jgi:general secretion pathway protein B
MSYILDALKKLEHEKIRKSRRDGMTSISGTLFESERPAPSGPVGWKIVLAVLVAVLVTFTATWLFLQSRKGPLHSPARLASQRPAASPVAPVSPVAVENAPVQPASPVVPVQQAPPAAPPAPAIEPPARPPAPSSTSRKAAERVVTATDDLEERSPTKKSRAQAAPPEQVTAAPADINLSGIAWQEERRARRAVVNGFLMKEGGVVSGARITDIYQDRVRFSQSGKNFEIPLISSGVPATVK